jgi:hypothetical protein
MEMIVLRMIGAVANALIIRPTTGNIPPADWKRALKALNRATKMYACKRGFLLKF